MVIVILVGFFSPKVINSSVFAVFSTAKDQSESPSRNSARYETTSPKLGFQSSIEVYDDIDEMTIGYAELQSVKPGEQGAISSDAPEPPPPRPPHEYLALIDV